ncbi:C2 domain-containing protein 5-like isoform X2 [Oscarella lobularis]|uniref:C2 domain-containing protein 5-like isoform X2 n=1 Tax=Oscarella lobularis TaxID=121494 RepID=UPI003313BABB
MDVRYGTKTSQMITVVQKKTILHPQEFADEQFSKIFNEILQLVSFKLSKSFPCCLCNLRFDCDLPDEDEVQLCVTGVVLSASKLTPTKRQGSSYIVSIALLSDGRVAKESTPGEDLPFTLKEIGDQAIRKSFRGVSRRLISLGGLMH